MTERSKGSEAVDDSEDWYCLNCDHEMPIGAMVCEHCGKDGNTLPEELWRDVWSQTVH
jgi:hypothetical protein